MNKFILYCDESGAKGFATQAENYPGEVGVFAGVGLTSDMLSRVKPTFDAIVAKHMPLSGKLHIADLPVGQQNVLRNDIYTAIKQHCLPCFWYAIHVQGFAEFFQTTEAVKEQARVASANRQGGGRYKRGSPRSDPPSLHVELFEGLYSHVVALIAERGKYGVEIEIRTDNVDAPIAKEFNLVAAELLSEQPQVSRSSAYDTVEGKVVHGSITSSMALPPDLRFAPHIGGLSIKTVDDSDGLVLAADVLSNSLAYHFKKRGPEDLYKPLNRPEAVRGHPLERNLDVFRDWGDGDLVGDGLYRHPKATDAEAGADQGKTK